MMFWFEYVLVFFELLDKLNFFVLVVLIVGRILVCFDFLVDCS